MNTYAIEGPPISSASKKRTAANSEHVKNAQRQNEIQYTTSTGYYSNVGSSSKKPRRIKRNKSPQSSQQQVAQSMLMYLHPEFHYNNAAHNSMFMHPNYPFVAAQQPSMHLPVFSNAQQEQNRQ